MGNGSKRQYTLEFKQQAAELAKEIGISQAALKEIFQKVVDELSNGNLVIS